MNTQRAENDDYVTGAGVQNAAGSRKNTLRGLLKDGQPLVLPGVYDALSTRMAEAAGARAACISGAAVGISQHAFPDVGLQNLGEYRASVTNIAAASRLPLLLDAEDGFGDARHVARTVTIFEDMGVAGLILEDLRAAAAGRPASLAPMAEMAAKLETAMRARRRADTFLVGRTDAAHVENFGVALERARRYEDIGVDAILATGLQDLQQMQRLRDHVKTPLVAIGAPGKTWVCPGVADAARLGYEILVLPLTPLLAAMAGLAQAYGAIAQNDTGRLPTAAALAALPGLVRADYWNGLA